MMSLSRSLPLTLTLVLETQWFAFRIHMHEYKNIINHINKGLLLRVGLQSLLSSEENSVILVTWLSEVLGCIYSTR